MIKILIKQLKKIRKKLQLLLNKFGSKQRFKKLNNRDITIISNNCFAGITYEYLNLPFLSPTIGLYFFAPEYLKFIKNLKHYAESELKQLKASDSKYYSELKKLNQEHCIIGIIEDVEIVFLHYESFEEAKSKWERRCKRINYDNLIFKFNDQNLCTEKELLEFKNFKAKNKICFTSKKYDYPNFIWMKKYQKRAFVREDSFYYHKYFNIIDYINNIKK